MFWIAVVFSNSLGTAFGDFLVDNLALGYFDAALVCAAVIAVVLALHYHEGDEPGQRCSGSRLCSLGHLARHFGDFLTKPVDTWRS
jgi:uncharacterized membrane-anchored protein